MARKENRDSTLDDAEAREELVHSQRQVNEELVLSSLRTIEGIEHAENEAAQLRVSEAALRASEEQLRVMADTLPHLAWYANPDGHIPWYNRRWFEYTGTRVDEQREDSWQAAHDPIDFPRIVAKWKEALSSGEPWEDECRLLGHDGRYRWFLSRAMPFRDPNGRIVRWFGTHVDIDDQRRADAEMTRLLASEQEARREAEAVNRVKDEFLATMSHELRTPLSAIVGWASLLREGALNDDDARRALATIERNAKAQARLIDDLLDVSRIISGKLRLDMQRVELGAFLRHAVDVVAPTADTKQIVLVVDIEDELPTIAGDSDRLQQIAWNLLSNAVRFTPRGGRIAITAKRVGEEVEVRFVDNGAGIAAENLSHVFERFRQVDGSTTRKHGGLGLGLAIVRHLVELHGGSIGVESAGLGFGSSFVVRFPMRAVFSELLTDEGPESELGDSARPPVETRLEGVRVLVVEDQVDAREIISVTLQRTGAAVVAVDTAAAAMAAIDAAVPDLLISDIGMPDEDGYSLIRKVRSRPASRGGAIPAIALTAYARSDDAKRALEAGFQEHVTKPVEANRLTEAVARVTGLRKVDGLAKVDNETKVG